MKIGLTFNLRQEIPAGQGPTDLGEEFDCEDTIHAIALELGKMGHEVKKLGWGKQFLQGILSEEIDLVFNIAEGMGGRSREAQVPAVLEMLGIPYTFSDALTLSICMDKALTKRLVEAIGVKTPGFLVGNGMEDFHQHTLKFPLFVKPALEGSSKGIRLHSKVNNQAELERQVAWLLEAYGPQSILVEEFIQGREVTVGILGNEKPFVLGIMEIKGKNAGEEFIYSLEMKRNWVEEVEYACPARLEDSISEKVAGEALKVFKHLGCRDAARLDFRIDRSGQPFFLEANPLAGLSPVYSDLPIMATKMGHSYPWLLRTIVDLAVERHRTKNQQVRP
ncbi:MAG: ATP-grasp domain-containing protein [Firmicutes bacterium]|nr:ATP-grasp domain-containing protein [Bacillota bacterium]